MSLRQRSSITDQPPPPSTSSTTNLPDSPTPPPSPRPPSLNSQNALSQALESSAHLANFLPTGTLLAFQLLTPIFTNNGYCDIATHSLTSILLVVLALSCFLASFTDSVKSSDGQIYYGFATLKGLWLFDDANARSSGVPDLSNYKLGFLDFVHAFLSVLVFVAVALRDKNVVRCLYPTPGHEVEEVLDIVPIGIGVIASLLFLAFPSKRHGIGYPVTRDK